MNLAMLTVSAHQHLLVVLAEGREQGSLDVKMLLKQLQRSIQFEEKLTDLYSQPSPVNMMFESERDEPETPTNGDDKKTMSADSIKKKYAALKKQENAKAREALYVKRQETLKNGKRKSWILGQTLEFKGLISKTFAPFMTQYVEHIRSKIDSIIADVLKDEVRTSCLCCLNISGLGS